jgi:CubicO group peptidase (beta-lactamase class C family)
MMKTCRFIFFLIALFCWFVPPAAARLYDSAPDTGRIDRIMNDAISRGMIAGGVVLVGTDRGTLFDKAYGRVGPGESRTMTTDTVFDVASLTKVLATAPAIMKLAEEGALSLVDPVVRWFPEFAGSGKDGLLVVHLLTHTSGLDDISSTRVTSMQSVIAAVFAQQLKGEPGYRFRYADINFMLLGELVRRASGIGLDRFAERYFYAPLGMSDTMFNPMQRVAVRCAATLDSDGQPQSGLVQDANSRSLGGVAGHAGLFSSAADLGRYCMMLLGGGMSAEGSRVLTRRAFDQMTAPYFSRGGKVVRGLGWDIASPFSSPRCSEFSEMSFGHTGYSGSSIWIDPERNLFVILLTSRLEYRHITDFSHLRGDVSSAAAGIFAQNDLVASSRYH